MGIHARDRLKRWLRHFLPLRAISTLNAAFALPLFLTVPLAAVRVRDAGVEWDE